MMIRKKLLVFIVAYNAAKKITSVLDRIPSDLSQRYEVEVLLIDDGSSDGTVDVARCHINNGFWCTTKVLKNPNNQGYGGNQKIGYRYAIDNAFDLVVLLHGDGQYAPEFMPDLLAPFEADLTPAAVFGSRMIDRGGALTGC
jgi:glycosyltransferase involved in cell wall biosynthesis